MMCVKIENDHNPFLHFGFQFYNRVISVTDSCASFDPIMSSVIPEARQRILAEADLRIRRNKTLVDNSLSAVFSSDRP